MTLRSRLPVLLSEALARGYTIEFGNFLNEPFIWWKGPLLDTGDQDVGHQHLDQFVPGNHGANTILMEQLLLDIINNRGPK